MAIERASRIVKITAYTLYQRLAQRPFTVCKCLLLVFFRLQCSHRSCTFLSVLLPPFETGMIGSYRLHYSVWVEKAKMSSTSI